MKLPAAADLLIDGYNLLHARNRRGPAKGPGNLERARTGLLRGIAAAVPDPARVAVVFDSRPERPPLRPEQPEWSVVFGIRVAFARGYAEADGFIADLCRTWPHPSRLWVVSDDRQVQDAARRCGARWLDCAAFLQVDGKGARMQTARPQVESRDHAVDEIETKFWLDAFSEPEEKPAVVEKAIRREPPVVPPPPEKPKSLLDPSLQDFYRDMLSSEKEEE